MGLDHWWLHFSRRREPRSIESGGTDSFGEPAASSGPCRKRDSGAASATKSASGCSGRSGWPGVGWRPWCDWREDDRSGMKSGTTRSSPAALHVVFVTCFFGQRMSWTYYFAILVLGLAVRAKGPGKHVIVAWCLAVLL